MTRSSPRSGHRRVRSLSSKNWPDRGVITRKLEARKLEEQIVQAKSKEKLEEIDHEIEVSRYWKKITQTKAKELKRKLKSKLKDSLYLTST